jgi:hypothetical protein
MKNMILPRYLEKKFTFNIQKFLYVKCIWKILLKEAGADQEKFILII